MRRRSFLTLLGGAAAAWPLAARAQQAAMPVIAYLSTRSAQSDVVMLAAFRRGLNEMGFAEGRNLTIEYRFADGVSERLTAMAADLIRRRVAVIVHAGAGPPPFTPDAAWQQMRASQIPIVFNMGGDPVALGFVASMSRPGGNMTGINTLVGELTGKNMGLLLELVPTAKTVAVLTGPPSNIRFGPLIDAREAAAKLGLQIREFNAGTDSELETAFAALNREPVDAMVIATSPFFVTRAKEIAALAARQRVPAIYARREFAEGGGLMSYGYDVADGYRHMGIYAGRILRGDKPADLPVFQPTKFQFIINLKTAKAIGLDIPAKLLALADEVIE